MRRHAQRFAQHAIDPHPHDQRRFIGLDVNIGYTLPHGIGQDSIDQADCGCIVRAVEEIFGRRDAACNQVKVAATPERVGCCCCGVAIHGIGGRQ